MSVAQQYAIARQKKKSAYPDETEGGRMAADIRRRANKMTPAQREECLKQAMQILKPI